jgi:hypothetical protein
MFAVRNALTRTLAGLTLSGAALLALPAAAAHAFDSSHLAIVSMGSNQYQVTVTCTVSNSPADVIGFTLKGEDTFSDDTLAAFNGYGVAIVSGDVLDEDWLDSDEIYANAACRDRNGTIHNFRTNTVYGSY